MNKGNSKAIKGSYNRPQLIKYGSMATIVRSGCHGLYGDNGGKWKHVS